jgi:proteasome beta subunit
MDEDLKKHVIKTGTTTIGVVCKDGIVIAADKRGTYGGDGGVSYIAGSNQEKVQEVTPNIIVTTAGGASDTRRVIQLVKAELKLKELKSRCKPTIKQAANLFSSIAFQNIRKPSMIVAITHFLLAGFDDSGFYLYDISPDGYLQELDDYAATGSGMVHTNPILDSEYKKDITMEEGIKLARKCINASLKRDPASGDGIDIYTVTKDTIQQVVKEKFETVAKK